MWLSCYGTSSASMTKLSATKHYIEFISGALQMFKNDIGRYPSEDEGLELLVNPTPGLESKWHGPFYRKGIPNDPWRNKYAYHYPARYGNKDFDLYSFGANGQDDKGERDDITNWREVNYEYYGGLSKTGNILAYFVSIILFIALVFCLVRLWKPSLTELPRRFALTTSLSVIIPALWTLWSIFFTSADNAISPYIVPFIVVCIFGFSVVGTIISLVVFKKGRSKAKLFLYATINSLPVLTFCGVLIYMKIHFG